MGRLQTEHDSDDRDLQWVKDIRNGGTKAFEALFRAYFEALCEFTLRYVHSYEISEEIVQGIFCDLWDRRRDWYLKGTVKAYLYRAARNKSLSYLKHRRIKERWVAQAERQNEPRSESPEDALRYKELSQAMQQAIDALPERRRLIYIMARQHGLSYAEIAAVLDISTKTVENQLGRALKYLRNRLAMLLSVLL